MYTFLLTYDDIYLNSKNFAVTEGQFLYGIKWFSCGLESPRTQKVIVIHWWMYSN